MREHLCRARRLPFPHRLRQRRAAEVHPAVNVSCGLQGVALERRPRVQAAAALLRDVPERGGSACVELCPADTPAQHRRDRLICLRDLQEDTGVFGNQLRLQEQPRVGGAPDQLLCPQQVPA